MANTAKTLSHINRFAGNYGHYSVAQHSYIVSAVVRRMGGSYSEQLAALHHDDAEMVTNDIPSPVKDLCTDIRSLESRLNKAINERYQVDVEAEIVKRADKLVLASEISKLVPEQDRWIYAVTLAEVSKDEYYGKFIIRHEDMVPWYPDVAAAKYIDLHNTLIRLETSEWIRIAEEMSPQGNANN